MSTIRLIKRRERGTPKHAVRYSVWTEDGRLVCPATHTPLTDAARSLVASGGAGERIELWREGMPYPDIFAPVSVAAAITPRERDKAGLAYEKFVPREMGEAA